MQNWPNYYRLLRAKAMLMNEAYKNPADYDENLCRATAAEVLARRIVHNLPIDKLESVMSTRYRYRESDGDESAPSSALETAIDQHGTVSSISSCLPPMVQALCFRFSCLHLRLNTSWTAYGEVIGSNETMITWISITFHINWRNPVASGPISIPTACQSQDTSQRLRSWYGPYFFLVSLFGLHSHSGLTRDYWLVYSQSVESPLESFNSERNWDGYEIVLYVMAVAFLIEGNLKSPFSFCSDKCQRDC